MLRNRKTTALTQEVTDAKGNGFVYKGREYIHHSNLHPHEIALHRLSGYQIYFLSALAILVMLFLFFSWHTTLVVLMATITFLYFADLLFNLFLIYRSFSKSPEIVVSDEEIAQVPEQQWPAYTIFCPLYNEAAVLPQFVEAMSKMDYPKEKLQVMLLLEDDDKKTIEAARTMNLPSYFTIQVVPHSHPKTKPKAMNYGLKKATGEYIVVYDAEDIPEAKQLKKAVIAFQKEGEKTVCIQAKLNFYNPHQNILTRVFTAEYSLWFELVLTGLQSINAPIPLGGTSNHFRKKDLHILRGWDSFNVTEDADLGIRLVKAGYRTAIVESTTLEEANSNGINWFWQRTRWIKGYIQTYFIHMRRPGDFPGIHKKPHFITFQLIVGGKVLSMFINPTMWAITILYFIFRNIAGAFIETLFSPAIFYMAASSLVFGNFLYMYYYMIGCKKHGHDELVKYAFLVPLYWLAMSIAAWVAFYKFITEPHHWSKTKHGLHLGEVTK